jgi:hypothetical protein
MSSDPKQVPIDVSELQYYFDAVERDSLDKMSHSRRSSEVLAIRDRLLTLPDKDFEAAVQTIKNILSPNSPASVPGDEQKAKRREAAELYEKTRAENPITILKAGSV